MLTEALALLGLTAVPAIGYLSFRLVRQRRAFRLCEDHNTALTSRIAVLRNDNSRLRTDLAAATPVDLDEAPEATMLPELTSRPSGARFLVRRYHKDKPEVLYHGDGGANARRCFEDAASNFENPVEFWDGDDCRSRKA